MAEKKYIELDDAIDALCNFNEKSPTGRTAKEIVKAIPAADVRPVVRGKWRLYSPLTDTYECDKCGYQVIDESFRTNFCPNCGADMREESR